MMHLGEQTEKKLKISTDHLCRLCTDLSEIRKSIGGACKTDPERTS